MATSGWVQGIAPRGLEVKRWNICLTNIVNLVKILYWVLLNLFFTAMPRTISHNKIHPFDVYAKFRKFLSIPSCLKAKMSLGSTVELTCHRQARMWHQIVILTSSNNDDPKGLKHLYNNSLHRKSKMAAVLLDKKCVFYECKTLGFRSIIFINSLPNSVGLSGSGLNWFRTYSSDREFIVTILPFLW